MTAIPSAPAPHQASASGIELSIEVFPPKTPEGAARLTGVMQQLRRLQPQHVSVTCGASGNPAEGTAALVDQLRADGFDAVPHLTCASATREHVLAIARDYQARGIHRIVGLRGDRPKERLTAEHEHYPFAADLVSALNDMGGFEISVAAYPEPHPEALSAEADLDNLKRKVDAGAVRAITQYCFETDTVLRFRDRMVAAGIDVPLVIGILPVNDFDQVRRFSERCGAGVPAWLAERFEVVRGDQAASADVAAEIGAAQARTLIEAGLARLHFYTLNRAALTIAICQRLGHAPALQAAA